MHEKHPHHSLCRTTVCRAQKKKVKKDKRKQHSASLGNHPSKVKAATNRRQLKEKVRGTKKD